MKKKAISIFLIIIIFALNIYTVSAETTENTTEPTTTTTTTVPTTKPVEKYLGYVNITLYVTKSNSTYCGNDLKFTSKDSSIAKVDNKGKITGVKSGKTVIKALNTKTYVYLNINVTVKNLPTPKLNKTSVSIKRGKSVTLKIKNKMTTANFYKVQKGKNVKTVKNLCTITNAGKITISKKAKTGTTFTVCVKVNNKILKCKVKVI